MGSDLVLGVDGGKSKTICLLADTEHAIIGAARAGSSDKYDVPIEQSLDTIAECVEEAANKAGVSLPVRAGCFGLAGADWPQDFEELKQGLVKRALVEQVLVKNDMHIALHANSDYGVVVSAGTHLASAIRTPDGEEWHAGWFAVEGAGGVSAGHRVIWAVLHAYDGRGNKTALTDLVLEETGKTNPLELLQELSEGRIDDAYLAKLAPLVFQAHYDFGDTVASEIIMDIGKEIACWATGLLARYHLLNDEVPVFLTGGLFKGVGTLLMDTVRMMVHARAPKTTIRIAGREPAFGALVYAYEMIGYQMTPRVIRMLEQTSPGVDFFATV